MTNHNGGNSCSVAIGEEHSQTVGQCTRNRAVACVSAMTRRPEGGWVVRDLPSHCILHSAQSLQCCLQFGFEFVSRKWVDNLLCDPLLLRGEGGRDAARLKIW